MKTPAQVAFEFWKIMTPEGMGSYSSDDVKFEAAMVASGVDEAEFNALTAKAVAEAVARFRSRTCCTGPSCNCPSNGD